MVKILWFSRHEMTAAQLADLRRIYGEEVCVKQVSATVGSGKLVAAYGAGCDVLAVDLPLNLLAELLDSQVNTKPVIRSVANRIPTGNTVVNPATGKEELEYKFEHVAWEQVLKVEIVTKRL